MKTTQFPFEHDLPPEFKIVDLEYLTFNISFKMNIEYFRITVRYANQNKIRK